MSVRTGPRSCSGTCLMLQATWKANRPAAYVPSVEGCQPRPMISLILASSAAVKEDDASGTALMGRHKASRSTALQCGRRGEMAGVRPGG